jgi:hypothetical protein
MVRSIGGHNTLLFFEVRAMFTCHHRVFAAVLLAVAVQASLGPLDAYAQVRTPGPTLDDSKPSPSTSGEPRSLMTAFDALGNEWVTSRFDDARAKDFASDVLGSRDLFVRESAPRDLGAPHRLGTSRDVWNVETRSSDSAFNRRPRFRIADALNNAGVGTGTLSVRSAARASQAEARRAIVNALARTPLGKALGRVFLIHRDDPDELGPDGEGPTPWSKVFPLLNPRLNARTRTVAMSFVWRF